MTSNFVPSSGIYRRYETHHKKTLTLYVTRQNQQFTIAQGVTLSDLELIRSSVELVGEPGFAYTTQVGRGHTEGAYDTAGSDTAEVNFTYGSTLNTLYAMNQTGSSTVLSTTEPNAVIHKTHLNHGWVNVAITGMTQGRSFMRDDGYEDNSFDLILPTDNGLISTRAAQQSGAPHTIKLENVQLEPRVVVNTQFSGNWPKSRRVARFVEDFADTDATTLRNDDGTVKYYDASGSGACQIPSNMINCMILQFTMTPRNTV